MKDADDKNHYVPNEETAVIVKKIFEMLKAGILPTEVAQHLNDNKVPVPSESVGNVHTRTVNEIKRLWNRTTVVRIARDKTYLGYVINGKSKKLSYKSKKVMQNPKEQHIEVENMHTPLIDKETFDIVQKMIDSRKHTRKYKYDFLFKGILECAECGKKLSILTQKQKDGNQIQYLRCNTYASMTRLKLCTPHSNNYEKLSKQIISTIKQRLRNYLKEEELYQIALNVKNSNAYKKNILQTQISSIKSKVELLNKKIDQLYEDKLNEVIRVEDFDRIYTSTLERKKELEQTIIELEKQKEETSNEVDLKKAVNDFIKSKKITREQLVSVVDRITVSESKEVKIYYKFSVLNESSYQNINQNESKIIEMKTA